jgi:hypothetical protein
MCKAGLMKRKDIRMGWQIERWYVPFWGVREVKQITVVAKYREYNGNF